MIGIEIFTRYVSAFSQNAKIWSLPCVAAFGETSLAASRDKRTPEALAISLPTSKHNDLAKYESVADRTEGLLKS